MRVGSDSKHRRIIYDDSTRVALNRNELSRNVSARAEKHDVDLVERFFAEFFDSDRLISKLNFLAGGFSRRERANTRHRKISALQHAEKFRAYRAGRANNGDVIFFAHRGEL